MRADERFFVDSNLLLYSVDPGDAGKRTRALAWMDRLWSAGAGALSWQVLHEFYWNATRKMGMDATLARAMVADLAHWHPVDTTVGLVQQAWRWMDEAPLAYWDALIVAAAQRSGARYLLSEDFQANRSYEDLQVINPFGAESAELLRARD